MNIMFNDVTCILQGQADVSSFARPSLSLFGVGGAGPQDYDKPGLKPNWRGGVEKEPS